VHSVSKHRCYVLEQYHEIDTRIVKESDHSLNTVRSLSMPHELLMIMRIFFKLGKCEIGSGKQIL